MKVLMTTLLLALISFNTWAVDATHGMVLFGTEKLMAYHLPMFHKIHAKQVVLQYTLPDSLKTELLAHQSEGFLTFVPTPFDLEKFLANPFALKGDIYKGHFEKDGELVMSNVTLENVKVLYANGISKGSEPKETYRVFGTISDYYSVHLLSKGVAKDHILKLEVSLWDYLEPLIEKGLYVESSNGLLVEGSESSIENFPSVKIINQKTIFSDDVM